MPLWAENQLCYPPRPAGPTPPSLLGLPSVITHPSLIHHSSITHPSLIYHSSITHPSLIHHSSITHPSLIHHSPIRSNLFLCSTCARHANLSLLALSLTDRIHVFGADTHTPLLTGGTQNWWDLTVLKSAYACSNGWRAQMILLSQR